MRDKSYWVSQGATVVDVTAKSARGSAKALAPGWPMVMGYKNGRLTESEYTEQYMEILRKEQRENKERWEKFIRKNDERLVVYLCFCRKGNFCHRLLLAREVVHYTKTVMGREALLVEES